MLAHFFTLAFTYYIAYLKLLPFLYQQKEIYVTPKKLQLFLTERRSELILASGQTGTRRQQYFDTDNQRERSKNCC
jgi:hypothetical protein